MIEKCIRSIIRLRLVNHFHHHMIKLVRLCNIEVGYTLFACVMDIKTSGTELPARHMAKQYLNFLINRSSKRFFFFFFNEKGFKASCLFLKSIYAFLDLRFDHS